MSENPSDPVPGHVRRQLKSESARAPEPEPMLDDDEDYEEPVIFVDVPGAPADAPAGSAMQDRDLVRMVENALRRARCHSDSIKALPFETTQHSAHRERERVRVFAREEEGGILVGVRDSRRPDMEVPGILLRRAPAPYDNGFTLTGRGALETRACNRVVADMVMGFGVELMSDELAALCPVEGTFKVGYFRGVYGSLFDAAFPEWEEFTGEAREPAEETGNAPRF